MKEQLPVVFVRHKLDADKNLFTKWYEKGLAVLHYEKELAKDKKMSIDPEDFDNPHSGRRAMRTLSRYCDSGALVVVDYNRYGFKNFLIGLLPPKSKITPMVEKVEKSDKYQEGIAYYRMVNLKDCIRLHHSDPRIRPLLNVQPRQGCVVNWTKEHIDEYVRRLYKATLTHSTLCSDFLIDYQWEVLCSEYLRRDVADSLRIDYLLTPVGRTMKDVDIVGANQEFYVLAQVSLTKNPRDVREKIDSLLIYSEKATSKAKKTILVYFGPQEVQEIVEKSNAIIFIPITKVREKLKTLGIIEDMIPYYDA